MMNNEKKLSIAECLKVGFTGVLDNFALLFFTSLSFLLSTLMLVISLMIVSIILFPSVQKPDVRAQVSTQEVVQESATPQDAQTASTLSAEKNKRISCSSSFNCGIRMALWSAKTTLATFLYAVWQGSLVFILFFLLFCLALIGLSLGYIKMSLELNDTGTSTIKTLFSQFNKSFTGFAASLLYYVMVVGGLILFIFPGIMAMIRFGYYRHFIVDKDAGVLESLSKSFDATRGYSWPICSLLLLEGGIMAISAPLLLITQNMIVLANTHAYRILSPK